MDNKMTLAAAALAALTMAAGCAPGSKTAKTADGAALSTPPAGKAGECYGVNTCKGTGECGGPGHSCAGQNACKGQGWITLTQKVCEDRHGTFKKS